MKSVKLEKAKFVGWFLTIGEDMVENRWAVTSLELWTLKKMIDAKMKEILQEIEEE